MNTINFLERDMTASEFSQMKAGFDSHDIEHGNPVEASERYSFGVMDGENFVGCASELTEQNHKMIPARFFDDYFSIINT